MAGSRSNPGQTVTRARGRFGTTSFGSRRRLCPAYLSPAFSFWRVSSYLMTRLSPHLPSRPVRKRVDAAADAVVDQVGYSFAAGHEFG